MYSDCGSSVIKHGSKTWQVKEHNVIRLERNDTRMVRWMCNVSPDDKISAVEFGVD